VASEKPTIKQYLFEFGNGAKGEGIIEVSAKFWRSLYFLLKQKPPCGGFCERGPQQGASQRDSNIIPFRGLSNKNPPLEDLVSAERFELSTNGLKESVG
jgi:hypothetical protein